MTTTTSHDGLSFRTDPNRTLAAGGDHTCAILDDGTVSCWGSNQYGQLGDGTNTDSSTPTPTSSLGAGRTAVSIAAGTAHTCALLDDATVACWGMANFGQLANGASRVGYDENTPDSRPSWVHTL